MSLMSGSVTAGRGDDSTSSSLPSSEARRTENGSVVQNMGSTDSAGNARGPSCSLVSTLLSNNCRGSAEAFARCLHRRLTSLGNENGSPERAPDASQPLETSWLHPTATSSGNRRVKSLTANNQHSIHQHQPRHSPETDLFYEVVEDDEPGSPAEEATAAEMAHLLVNSKANHQTNACHCSPSGTRALEDVHQRDPESGCVFASPFSSTPPDSDSSEIFFDPESSESEKPKAEVFFDPVSTSDSEATSSLSNTSVPAKATVPPNERGRATSCPERCEDTSESSCSSRRSGLAVCKNGSQQRRDEPVGSSEDSFGRSSQETTSPSHESLWSTFDDSTVSLQDESPPWAGLGSDPHPVPHICLPKSHSDSELPSNGVLAETSVELGGRNEEHVGNAELGSAAESVAPVVRHELTIADDSPTSAGCLANNNSEERESCCTDTIESEEARMSKNGPSEPSVLTAVSDYSSCAAEARDEELTSLQTIVGNENNTDVCDTNDEEKLCLLLKKLDGTAKEGGDLSPEGQSETVEEEEDRPQRVRRCSSLKTGKTPPGTPGRKKIVRFADKLGLDLADVRTFLDEIPRIPNSAYNDLIYDDIFRPQHSGGGTENVAASSTCDANWCYQDDVGRRKSASAVPSRKIDRTLVPLFQQPGGMGNFLDVVRERRVCLENALVQDPVTLAIQGTVRVINLDFHKSVHIRYTLNAWRNFSDLQATYVPNSCDGFSDKFSFVLYCHTLSVGQRLEFAVRFQCKGVQYWDNNSGANYCFQCLPASSPTGYIPITAEENRRASWSSPMFY